MTDILYCYCYTITIVPGGTAWFIIRHLGRGPGYVRDPLIIQIMSPINEFQLHRTPIDMCSMRSMGCAYYRWQLVFANIINDNELVGTCFDEDVCDT